MNIFKEIKKIRENSKKIEMLEHTVRYLESRSKLCWDKLFAHDDRIDILEFLNENSSGVSIETKHASDDNKWTTPFQTVVVYVKDSEFHEIEMLRSLTCPKVKKIHAVADDEFILVLDDEYWILNTSHHTLLPVRKGTIEALVNKGVYTPPKNTHNNQNKNDMICRAKKPYSCAVCGRSIPVGEYYKRKNINYRGVTHTCMSCYKNNMIFTSTDVEKMPNYEDYIFEQSLMNDVKEW